VPEEERSSPVPLPRPPPHIFAHVFPPSPAGRSDDRRPGASLRKMAPGHFATLTIQNCPSPRGAFYHGRCAHFRRRLQTINAIRAGLQNQVIPVGDVYSPAAHGALKRYPLRHPPSSKKKLTVRKALSKRRHPEFFLNWQRPAAGGRFSQCSQLLANSGLAATLVLILLATGHFS